MSQCCNRRYGVLSMNRFLAGALVATLGVLTAGQAWATTSTESFTPSLSSLCTLEHGYYYSWGIPFQPSSAGTIISATLSIEGINNTAVGTNILYIRLLNNPQPGVNSFYGDTNGVDDWAGQGPLVGTYVASNIGQTENISFDLTSLVSAMNAYTAVNGVDYGIWQNNYGLSGAAATFATGDFNGDGIVDGEDYGVWQSRYGTDGTFGIGFYPQCQYNDTGVTLTLTMAAPQAGAPSVPEPATMAGVLLAIGALGTYVRGRFRTR
jgi:hypothetical protein